MWQISELKERAHANVSAAYWRSVLTALVLALLTGGVGVFAAFVLAVVLMNLFGYGSAELYLEESFGGLDDFGGNGSGADGFGGDFGGGSGSGAEAFGLSFGMDIPGFGFDMSARVAYLLFGLVLLVTVVAVCVVLFVLIPIRVGCRRFFIVNHAMPGRAKSSEMFHLFNDHYLHGIGTMLLRAIYLTIWALILPAIAITAVNILNWYDPSLHLYLPLWVQALLAFPAFIKGYTYMLVPYITAEEPGMPAGEVIALSKDMMRGNKMHAFGLDLSFLGWDLLDCFTLGLLGVLYVSPYKAATKTEMYTAIRDDYLRNHTGENAGA